MVKLAVCSYSGIDDDVVASLQVSNIFSCSQAVGFISAAGDFQILSPEPLALKLNCNSFDSL